MIGYITVGVTKAVLDNRGVWSSPDNGLTLYLNRFHSAVDDGPSDGQWGHRRIRDAARLLGGECWFQPTLPTPLGDDGAPPVY